MNTMTMALNTKINWSDSGTSIGIDGMCLLLALALHSPLYFVKFDMHKKAVDLDKRERLVAVDIMDSLPKPKVDVPPPPPVVTEKKMSLMDKIKAMVKKDVPKPVPVKPVEPPKELLDVAKKIELAPKIDLPKPVVPTLQEKGSFKTAVDPNLIKNEQKMLTNLGSAAPLTVRKVGVIENRNQLKNDKGAFQIARNELSSIEGKGPALSVAAAPVIAIRSGSKGSTENFSAAGPQKTDKGRLGAMPATEIGGGPQLGLRDQIIARDGKVASIDTGSRAGVGAPGGIPGAGVKKDAGSFKGGAPGGVLGGTGVGSVGSVPQIASVPVAQKKPKKDMFTITGPLKDRKIERKVLPEYPSWMEAQGLEATVIIQITVEPTGLVKLLMTVVRTSGYAKLDEEAKTALRQWKFTPLPDGETREEVGQVTLSYSLN